MLAAAAPVAAATGVAAAEQGAALGRDQSRVRDRMREVEEHLLEMAHLLDADQPEKADQLRRALSLSRERFIVSHMEDIRGLLGEERFGEAGGLQEEVLADLASLAAMLTDEDSAGELARLREAEKALSSLLQDQSALAARQRRRDLADEQAGLAERSDDLKERLRGGPGADELGGATDAMRSAETALRAGEFERAAGAQEEAAEHLADALALVRRTINRLAERRANLVRRQVRTLLSTMLEKQRTVGAETEQTARDFARAERLTRAMRLAAAGLAAAQDGLAEQAAEAADVAGRDTTLPAMPVALAGVREDMAAAAALLRDTDLGPATRRLQAQIEEALAALLDVLKPGLMPPVGQAGSPSKMRKEKDGAELSVDLLAELRIVRAVQGPLASRTAVLDELRGPGAGLDAEAARLAGRQSGITTIVRRLASALADADANAAAVRFRALAAMSDDAAAALRRVDGAADAHKVQREILGELDQLIAALEQQGGASATLKGGTEESGQQRPGAKTGAPRKAAEKTTLPGGQWQFGKQRDEEDADEAWMPDLPAAEKQAVRDALEAGRMPPRYRELLREYNKRLAAE